jgi:hypothetical protein
MGRSDDDEASVAVIAPKSIDTNKNRMASLTMLVRLPKSHGFWANDSEPVRRGSSAKIRCDNFVHRFLSLRHRFLIAPMLANPSDSPPLLPPFAGAILWMQYRPL